VAVGSMIEKPVCGKKTPLALQKLTILLPSFTLSAVAEVTLPGAAGTRLKFIPVNDEHEATGLIAPVFAPFLPSPAHS
jgi:hypothetical protein